MNERIKDELNLLQRYYRQVDYSKSDSMHWFQVHGFKTPDGWSPNEVSVVFCVTEGYPVAEPYGFFIPSELKHEGNSPSGNSPPHAPPFEGEWLLLSWAPDGWRALADINASSNLLNWVRTFSHRLQQGV